MKIIKTTKDEKSVCTKDRGKDTGLKDVSEELQKYLFNHVLNTSKLGRRGFSELI